VVVVRRIKRGSKVLGERANTILWLAASAVFISLSVVVFAHLPIIY
jgi:hypothetical protein